jgi:hypothetical protein
MGRGWPALCAGWRDWPAIAARFLNGSAAHSYRSCEKLSGLTSLLMPIISVRSGLTCSDSAPACRMAKLARENWVRFAKSYDGPFHGEASH